MQLDIAKQANELESNVLLLQEKERQIAAVSFTDLYILKSLFYKIYYTFYRVYPFYIILITYMTKLLHPDWSRGVKLIVNCSATNTKGEGSGPLVHYQLKIQCKYFEVRWQREGYDVHWFVRVCTLLSESW